MSQGGTVDFVTPEAVAQIGPGILSLIASMIPDYGPQRLTYGPKPSKRSAQQNALQHVWYADIAKQGGEMSARDARRYCKLTIGVPIMRGDTDEDSVRFRTHWDRLIKKALTYEEKLELMDWFPVTSLMKPEQFSRYLDAVQEAFAGRGIVLTGLEADPRGQG